MFWKKKPSKKDGNIYDLSVWSPVIRCSICNGEQVAGFKHLESGKFEEVMLIRNKHDLNDFKEKYGVTAIAKEY